MAANMAALEYIEYLLGNVSDSQPCKSKQIRVVEFKYYIYDIIEYSVIQDRDQYSTSHIWVLKLIVDWFSHGEVI